MICIPLFGLCKRQRDGRWQKRNRLWSHNIKAIIKLYSSHSCIAYSYLLQISFALRWLEAENLVPKTP